MDRSLLLPIMLGLGYVVFAFAIGSTWSRYRLGQAHIKNPQEAVSHALLSAAMGGHCILLVLFEPSTVIAVLLFLHVLQILVQRTLMLIFIESKRGQLGGEYYLHTQITYFLWIIHGMTFAYYAPLLVDVLAGHDVPHWPISRPLATIHPLAWLLLVGWWCRTGVMFWYARYALSHTPQPDARYDLEPTARILSLRFYRTP